MGIFASNPFRQLVATALVVSMSMCCCKLDTLLGELSGTAAGDSQQVATSSFEDGGKSCCSSKGDESPNLPERPTPAPLKNCECCGVISIAPGSVVGDASVESSAFLFELLCDTEATVVSQTVTAEPTDSVVEPPTLLHLHCALIV